MFQCATERSVLADNTFSLKNTRFEAPRDLRNRTVQVRFDRLLRRSRRLVRHHHAAELRRLRSRFAMSARAILEISAVSILHSHMISNRPLRGGAVLGLAEPR
jgi:hypothetical protein